MVEAGAGTGKTRALVDRVVSLVLGGRPIERIAAITFTEKAATELKDRIRAGLEAASDQSPRSNEVIDEAIGALDRAQISTIHSFCQSLLRNFSARSGTDPSFVVIDEVRAERRQQERWRLYLDQLVDESKAAAIVRRVLGLGMLPQELERLAADLTGRRELLALFTGRPLNAAVPAWPDIGGLLGDLDKLPMGKWSGDVKVPQKVEGLQSLLRDLIAADSADREAVLASSAGILEPKVGAGGDQVRAAIRETCSRLKETLDACRREALSDLMPIIVRFVQTEAEQRQRDGELTFDDLIVSTRELLRSDRGAVESFRQRFDALLIDEFQDTDPLQVDIAMAFGTNTLTASLEPGRLFLVGDPKQSIYRFRRADMGMYAKTRGVVEGEAGAFPELSVNKRSRSEVLSWVNGVFHKAMGDGGNPHIQPPYRAIVEERTDVLAGAGVAYFGGPAAKDVRVRDVRDAEAADAARICQQLVEEEWEVWDPANSQVRTAQFRDVALLMPSRLVLSPLEYALASAGVPYRVEGGSLVYRTQEVRDILNCLTAINDPDDEVAVVAALRSAAFACSDVELAQHKAVAGHFDFRRQDPAKGVERVRRALEVLATYHSSREGSSLSRLVERFCAERRIVETSVLDRGGRNTYRRMRFVVEQARLFEANGPESLREFVTWLENCSSRDFLDNEGAGLDDDEDAVRVLTMHGAKGLEFPIVVMVGMSAAPLDRPGTYLADHVTGEVAVRIGAATTNRRFEAGPYERMRDAESEHTRAEFVRTLYVAATRARDHLVFSLHRKDGAKGSGAAILEDGGAREKATRLEVRGIATGSGPSPLRELTVDVPSFATVDEFLSAQDELVSRSRRRLYTSATAEVRETGEGRAKEDAADETEPWARGRGGTRLGRAVHATIQSLAWDASSEGVEAVALAQAVAEAIPSRVGDVARLAERALQSQAAERARAARRALREAPFAVQSGDVTLEGFIDLLIEDDAGLEVVDWKTDQIAESEIERRLESYRLQAGLYVWGVQEATGMRVHRVTYVFASAGQEISPGEPRSLVELARRHLASRSGAPPPR
jgi:ATP-dependent exoDNAse (exonuclease V) beta subunit